RTIALELVAFDKNRADGNAIFKSHLELRDLTTDRLLHRFGEQHSFAPMGWLRFAPDGKMLFAVCSIDLDTGKSAVRRFDVATAALQGRMAIDGIHYATALTWDGKTRIASSNKIWDLMNDRMHWSPKKALGRIIAFMPDGKSVIAVHSESAVKDRWG